MIISVMHYRQEIVAVCKHSFSCFHSIVIVLNIFYNKQKYLFIVAMLCKIAFLFILSNVVQNDLGYAFPSQLCGSTLATSIRAASIYIIFQH